MVARDEFDQATARAERRRRTSPTALAARYDRRTGRIVIRLNSGLDVGFSPRDAQGLQDATPDDLAEIEISPSGFGIHFPRLDADLSLPGLLEGRLRSQQWMSAQRDAKGTRSRQTTPTAPAKRPSSRRAKTAAE